MNENTLKMIINEIKIKELQNRKNTDKNRKNAKYHEHWQKWKIMKKQEEIKTKNKNKEDY